MGKKRVLLTGNSQLVIFRFRLELIQRLLKEGYEVYTAFPKTVFGDGETIASQYGCHYIELEMEGHGTNPIAELKLIRQYKKIFKEVCPEIIFTYTIKPNIYGAIAASSLKIPCALNVSGLGIAVENPGVLQKITSTLYKIATRRVQCVFFQNQQNEQFFADRHIADGKRKILPGSGVNLADNHLEEYPAQRENIRFLYAGRIMKDKGIDELLEAVTLVKKDYPSIEMTVVGNCEDVYKETMGKADNSGLIRYLGHRNNIHEYMAAADCIVLPSYHEGMANVLLEAAATGRPVIATNVPGCKETFEEGVSGFGCEARNATDLAEVMKKFIRLPYEDKKAMGVAGRHKVEQQFDRKIVVDAYFNELKKVEKNEAC